jgi:uncharacterized protein (DUF697 family)
MIRRAARRASMAGALASVGASSGELLALFTEGLAAPIGLPAMALSMAGEAAYTAMIQIELACDLASIYGVPFDAEDLGEMTTLFCLALELEEKKKADEHAAPEGLTERLLTFEDGEIATRIGKKMLEDAFMRNVVPIAGVAVSARWNYVATKRLGAAAKRYSRYRRALVAACGRLRVGELEDPSVLVTGAWLLATADGDAGHEEIMAIALIMDALSEEKRRAIELDRALGDDEEAWFEAVAKTPKESHEALLDALVLIAATDRTLAASERRFLKRVGKALGREVDATRVRGICEHLARGEAPPPGFALA